MMMFHLSLWCTSAQSLGCHTWWYFSLLLFSGIIRQWSTKWHGFTNSNRWNFRFAPLLVSWYIHAACHKVVNKLEALCLNSHVSIIAQTSSSVDVMSFGFNFDTIARMRPGAYSWWRQTSSESPNQALHFSVWCLGSSFSAVNRIITQSCQPCLMADQYDFVAQYNLLLHFISFNK